MQACPVFIALAPRSAAAARSRLASASTIAGALPPSSRLTLVTFCAALAMIAEPAAELPVKLTMSTLRLATRCCPTVLPRPLTRLKTPGGNPASATIRANS
ncbi:hypothetical protein D9M69_691820 [compost metagenome]